MSGIGNDRLHLYWCSSAEAQRFTEIATEVTEAVRARGPFDPEAHRMALDAVEATLSGEVLRWAVGKELRVTARGDVYGRKWDTAGYEEVLDRVLEREYQIQLILQAVRGGCTAPRDVHGKIGLDLQRISYLMADMEKRNLIEFRRMEEKKPVFAAL